MVKKYECKAREMRRRDPFLDRRSGEDRRKVYSLDYFDDGNPDRRTEVERRSRIERRSDCIRVSTWSSVCPDSDDKEYREGMIRIGSPNGSDMSADFVVG